MSIYDGTGKGQLRSFVSADTLTNIITVASWTNVPDTTSKYRWWDADEQWHDWAPLTGVRFDSKDYTDRMFLMNPLTGFEGFRFRLFYLGWPSPLTLDSDETSVPKEFIINKALAILHDSMIGDNRVDRTMHGSTAEYYADRADEYARLHRRRVLAGTLWLDEDDEPHVSSVGDNTGNPMNW
jgi:hypothetical protein